MGKKEETKKQLAERLWKRLMLEGKRIVVELADQYKPEGEINNFYYKSRKEAEKKLRPFANLMERAAKFYAAASFLARKYGLSKKEIIGAAEKSYECARWASEITLPSSEHYFHISAAEEDRDENAVSLKEAVGFNYRDEFPYYDGDGKCLEVILTNSYFLIELFHKLFGVGKSINHGVIFPGEKLGFDELEDEVYKPKDCIPPQLNGFYTQYGEYCFILEAEKQEAAKRRGRVKKKSN